MVSFWNIPVLVWLAVAVNAGDGSECGRHEIYTPCSSSSCFETRCGVLPTLLCTKDCKSGCQCAKGFARNGTVCIAVADCPEMAAPENRDALGYTGTVGVLRLKYSTQRCVVGTQQPGAGDVLLLRVCNRRADLQLDVSQGHLRLRDTPELCLVTNSQEPAVGDLVMLSSCTDAAPKFKFNRLDGSIHVKGTNLCFDSKALVIALSVCSGERSQIFELFDNGCSDSLTAPVTDYGANDEFRGWYDVKGCGTCQDFCRWIGGSGGDPRDQTMVGSAYWSCALSGSVREFTLPGYFPEWNLTKCDVLSAFAEQPGRAMAPSPPDKVPRRVSRPGKLSPAPSPAQQSNSSEPTSDAPAMAAQAHLGRWSSLSKTRDFAIPLGILAGLIVCFLLSWLICCLCSRRKAETSTNVAEEKPINETGELEDSLEPGRRGAQPRPSA